MKRIISIGLSLLMLLSAVMILPVNAAVEDTADTDYIAGYVLHNMDFTTGAITSFDQTNYTVKCANSGYNIANNFAANKGALYKKDGTITSGGTATADGNGLRAYYNNNSTKTGKRIIWMTGNEIPTNIASYTVEFKVLIYTATAIDNYFGIVWGDAANQNGTNSIVFKPNGTIDGTAKTDADSTAMTKISTTLTGTQTQANWITFQVIVDGVENYPTVKISCDGNTAEYTATKKALTNYMGLIMGDGLNLNVASMRVIAGTPADYTELSWPAEENALVQSVGVDALVAEELSVNTAEDENNQYSVYIQKSNDETAVRVIMVTKKDTVADNDLTVKFTMSDNTTKTFTLGSEDIDLYTDVEAAGKRYAPTDGQYLFGAVIQDIPEGILDTVTQVDVTFGTAFTGSTNALNQ